MRKYKIASIAGDGIGLEVDPNMVADPTTSSYVRMDGWDDEAEKWFKEKLEATEA